MTIEIPPSLVTLTPRALLQGSGNADALENVEPSQLVSGSACWVIDQQEFYVLDKTSGAAVSPPSVIATILGAANPARWSMNATSGPPTGAAGGDLGGTYPNPTVIALEETGDPQRLLLGAIAAGALLQRSGNSIAGTLAFSSLQSSNSAGVDVDQAGTTGGVVASLGLPAVGTWAVWLGTSYALDAGAGPFIALTLTNPGAQPRLSVLTADSNTRDLSEFLIVESGGLSRTVTWTTTFGATPAIATFSSPQILAVRIS